MPVLPFSCRRFFPKCLVWESDPRSSGERESPVGPAASLGVTPEPLTSPLFSPQFTLLSASLRGEKILTLRSLGLTGASSGHRYSKLLPGRMESLCTWLSRKESQEGVVLFLVLS